MRPLVRWCLFPSLSRYSCPSDVVLYGEINKEEGEEGEEGEGGEGREGRGRGEGEGEGSKNLISRNKVLISSLEKNRLPIMENGSERSSIFFEPIAARKAPTAPLMRAKRPDKGKAPALSPPLSCRASKSMNMGFLVVMFRTLVYSK